MDTPKIPTSKDVIKIYYPKAEVIIERKLYKIKSSDLFGWFYFTINGYPTEEEAWDMSLASPIFRDTVIHRITLKHKDILTIELQDFVTNIMSAKLLTELSEEKKPVNKDPEGTIVGSRDW